MIPPFYFHSLLHPRLLPLSNLLLTLPLFLLPGPCPLKDLWMLELQVLPEVTVKQRKGAETGLMPNLLPSGNIFPSPKRYPPSLPLLNLSQNLNSIANFSVSRFLGLFKFSEAYKLQITIGSILNIVLLYINPNNDCLIRLNHLGFKVYVILFLFPSSKFQVPVPTTIKIEGCTIEASEVKMQLPFSWNLEDLYEKKICMQIFFLIV